MEGDVLTGLPISSAGDTHSVAMIEEYISTPGGTTVEILSAQGVAITDSFSTPMSTGQIIRVLNRDGQVLSEMPIVVMGDVLGRGELNIAQLVRLAHACIGERPLTGLYEAAGDFQGNGRIDIADVVREAQMIVNRSSRS